mmetsp:Transcript_58630/g.154046  ORF Transcript_58630/g.154046 Transcript_58630/m.154046 type:complete len:212 (+) Transcript_58630:429-1064(+)
MKNDPRSRNPTHSTCRSRAFCSCTSRMTNDCSGPAGPRRPLSSPASPSIACILAGTSVCAPSRSGPPSTLCVLRPVRASAGVALARACCPPPCRVSTAVHAGVAAPLLIRRVAVVLIVMPTVAVVATPADAIHIAVAVVLLLLVLVAARRTPSLPRLLRRRHRPPPASPPRHHASPSPISMHARYRPDQPVVHLTRRRSCSGDIVLCISFV